MADSERNGDAEARIIADYKASLSDIEAGRTADFDSVISRLDRRIRRLQVASEQAAVSVRAR